MSKCRIPVGAVAQRGLFRILLGSGVPAIADLQQKYYNEVMGENIDDWPWNERDNSIETRTLVHIATTNDPYNNTEYYPPLYRFRMFS